MKRTVAILMALLLLLTPVKVAARYGTKVIDGNLNDWATSDLVATGRDSGLQGANLDKLYIAWDDEYLYIAIKTNNTANWKVAYGIGIDVGPGGFTGSESGDSWGRKINFTREIDYEVYFWWDGKIWSDAFNHWNGTDWEKYSISEIGGEYAYTGDSSSGLQVLEVAIPWSALGGKPEKIAIITWIAGEEGSSAVDTLPVDPSIDYSNINGEWTDADMLSNFIEISLTKVIDGNLDDWNKAELVAQGVPSGIEGANLDRLYVSWDSNYLYIAIKTNNTAKYWPDYGVAIDVNPGSGIGGTYDPWAKKIYFSGTYLPDYIIYAEAQDGALTWVGLCKWDGNEWITGTNLNSVGEYAYIGGDNGIQTIEIKVPWSALGGMPEKIAIIAWVAGNEDGNSAVDTLPVDPSIDYSNINSEWDDEDTLTNFAELEIPKPLPDLAVSITGPSVIPVNKEVEFTITVKNLGAVEANDFNVTVYLNNTIVANKTLSLAPKNETSFKVNITVTSEGTYELRAVVDEDNIIRELNEDNNEASLLIKATWMGKIEVDGNPDDWPKVNVAENSYTVVNGTFIWIDAKGDQRHDKDPYLPGKSSSHADLVELGVTKDDRYIYFLFVFENMSNIKIGDNGATFIAVPIDYKSGGANWFAGEMDTRTVISWDIQMVVNLGTSDFKGQEYAVSGAGNDVNSILYFLDADGNVISLDALIGVNLSRNTIEVRIPVSALEGAKEFNFQVATGFSYGPAVWNFGDPFNNDKVSDIVDTISLTTTEEELKDNVPHYYVEITLNSGVESAKLVNYKVLEEERRKREAVNSFITVTRYYGLNVFPRLKLKFNELIVELSNETLPPALEAKIRDYESQVIELSKLYEEGKDELQRKALISGSVKVYKAYTRLLRIVREMQMILEKVRSGEISWEKEMEELKSKLGKEIDGDLTDWKVEPIAEDTEGYGQDGANIKELYVNYDDNFLYIALVTDNKASWRVAYGIALDYKEGGYISGGDAWGRKIDFARGVDAQLYFFWNGEFFGNPGTNNITSAQLILWTGTGWEYKNLDEVGFYAYTGGEEGLKTLEIAIPWEVLGGKPEKIYVVAYVAGQAPGDSAVDMLPLQDAVKDNEPGSEWGDEDYVTTFAEIQIS
ncbi:CARDB domain-containing protein [Pyrococcus abyssi]|nr:CARDB domain-containing protein [Pyrococcus abyssi]CCE70261.1 TPA: hypothetical protein PAB1790 [Pyrococcus abyssi GE5]